MYVKKVTLKNFRNYSFQEVEFKKGLNVIHGNNAQGKTNLLESIFVGAIGKSFKSVSEKEIISFGEKFSDIKIDYYANGRDMYNTVRLFNGKKKAVTLNGVALTKMSELVGNLTVVIFTPEELSLVKDGPGIRRRFADMAISQIKPKYMHILSKYNKALEQKNKLLKEIKNKPSLKETLSLWNEQLAQAGARIIILRREFLERIEKAAASVHREISLGKEDLTLFYKTLEGSEKLTSAEEVKDLLLKALQEGTEKEIILGQGIIGPHRDDVIFNINGNNAKIYGSQGQQRTIVLAVKLAQREIFLEESGQEPILLLDDILGELDITRREYLFSKIGSSQVFITCTDTDRIEEKGKNTAYFRVEGGHIREE